MGPTWAAKILAVNPKPTPPQVIEAIRNTVAKTVDRRRRTLISPMKAIAAAAMQAAPHSRCLHCPLV
jgi:hypothetical protein